MIISKVNSIMKLYKIKKVVIKPIAMFELFEIISKVLNDNE